MSRFEDLVARPAELVSTATEVNDVCVATAPAKPGYRHVVVGLVVSANDAPPPAVEVGRSNGVTWIPFKTQAVAFPPLIWNLPPVAFAVGAAVTLTVPAFGEDITVSATLLSFSRPL